VHALKAPAGELMKVLLINPEFPDTYWSFRHALPFEGRRCVFPPLGLLTVSALLPKEWEKRLVDLNVQPLKTADIEWADMVFATAMLVQKDSLRDVVKQSKALGKRVVLGGPYVTSTREELPPADHLFRGEAETTLPQFVDDLARGEAKAIYEAPERPQLSITPIADFGLADMKAYSAMSVQYSRGCPFSCEFCDIIEIYGRIPRTKSNQQIIAEFDALRDLGWRGTLFIVDDNFIGNKKNVRTLLPELAKWQKANGYPFSLITESSINLADDDALLENMREAGFCRVFIGIETPVEESLQEAQKTQNRGNLIDSVKKIQSYGMEVMAGFIVAIPLAMVGLLNALPDTQLWKRLEREGRLLGSDATGNNTVCTFNFKTRMDPAILVQGYQSIMRTIYSPREYYERVLDSMKRTAHQLVAPNHYGMFRGFTILTKIFLKLGIIDRERREFWRFFTHAVIKHRSRVPDSLRLAAVGYHFRKLSESYGSA
jgi:hypothetical protein